MERRILGKKEVKDLKLDFLDIEKGQVVEEITDKKKLLFVDNAPIAVEYENRWIPTLRGIRKPIKKIIVDAGAVKFVLSGANIMRPGVTKIEPGIEKDESIIILDPENKPLAVGIALFNSDEMEKMGRGKIVINVHQINDFIWNFKNH